MIEINAPLMGVQFRPAEAKAVVDSLTIGQRLELEAEPTNQYDANAVKVIEPESGEFIGYVAKVSNYETAQHLVAGGAYECEVLSFLGTRKPDLGITLLDDRDIAHYGEDQDD